MNKGTIAALLASALAIGAGSFAISGLFAKRDSNPAARQPPCIVVPSGVELGIIEMGRTARGQFVISNRGAEDLAISSVRSDCGCLGVFRFQSEEDRRFPFSTALIKSGDQITVELHFLVRGETGKKIEQGVYLVSNDPLNPEVRVACSAIPAGGALATPASLFIGSMRLGETKQASFEIRDDRRLGGCRVTQVLSSNPKLVSARFEITEGDDSDVDRSQLGQLVGRVQATVNAPNTPTTIEEVIRVFVDGTQEPLLLVPVTAKVEPRFQLHPAEIAMPRASSSGHSYSGRFFCRTISKSALKVSTAKLPDGFTIRFDESDRESIYRMGIVEFSPKNGLVLPATYPLTILLADDEASETLTLTVIVSTPK